MAKKKVQPIEDDKKEVVVEEKINTSEVKEDNSKKAKKVAKVEKDNKADKKVKDVKVDKKSKSKPKKDKKSLKKKAQEIMSELKKVSRPSFGKVVKNTCVVIAVVAICTLLLFGVDNLFGLLHKLLLPES